MRQVLSYIILYYKVFVSNILNKKTSITEVFYLNFNFDKNSMSG